jgi:type III pantothenate kinase
MFLCIDRGNSRTKTGVFNEQGLLVETNAIATNGLKEIKKIISEHHIQHVIISTSGKNDWDVTELKVSGMVVDLSHQTSLPIEIIYGTPETLGRDRIASSCGAHALFPGTNKLIVDAGTCVTMDLLLAKGIFLGGNIAPGISMRLSAMHEMTARLPLVEPGFPDLEFGNSTEHALQNGACLGVIMEIEGILNRAKKAYGDVSIVITGGDSGLLAANLESQIFVEPELVIHGLFQILSFNVKKTN